MKIRKIKIQGTLPKMGVWLPTLLAMHAQTNLNQGLLQVPPPLPSHPLLTLKTKLPMSASLFQQEKNQSVSNVMEVGKGKQSSLQLKGLRISS